MKVSEPPALAGGFSSRHPLTGGFDNAPPANAGGSDFTLQPFLRPQVLRAE